MRYPVPRVSLFIAVTGVCAFSTWAIISLSNSDSLRKQQEAQEPAPEFDRSKLEPVRPPLDDDVLALSERERDGVLGPVRKIWEYAESTSLVDLQWNPKWAKVSGRIINRMITYNLKGDMIDMYQQCGVPCTNCPKLIYDSKGRLVETVNYNEDGTINSRSVSTYDERGWETESKAYDANGNLLQKWNYKYVIDSHGNWIGKFCICVEGCPPEQKEDVLVECRSISYYKQAARW